MKFTDKEVLSIYRSTETIDHLAKQYGVSRYNIITIKRKIYYRKVTEHIEKLPGFTPDKKCSRFPIPIDLIEKIFYDTGDYTYFKEQYGASELVVKNIKSKITYRKITMKLRRTTVKLNDTE